MNYLLLGTQNRGKIRELRDLLRPIDGLTFLTQDDRPFSVVAETGATFVENALLKARAICSEVGLAVLAEDAGLEVPALGGAPGVLSARFAGEPVDPRKNNALLLEKLHATQDRRARFVAVSALCLLDGRVFATTGVCEGRITEQPAGEGGFGYDPLFVPEGETCTLAEMPREAKNRLSHRRRAIEAMIPILRKLLDDGAFIQG